MNRNELNHCNRVVIKIGSSLLEDNGDAPLSDIIGEIAELIDEGKEVVLVTSGAIYFGTKALGRTTPPITLPQKQATAATGQPLLMEFYQSKFDEHHLKTAQVLLTQDGIHNHQTYLNACNTMNELLDMGVIPVVNENDTVATEEIQFGNNDNLASLVTTMVDGDLLVILSDVAGLYPNDPATDDAPLSTIDTITDDVREMAEPADKNSTTVGGMITKIQAAEKLTQAGTSMVIADGRRDNILRKILSGDDVGTIFTENTPEDAVQGRKRWIGYHLPTKGSIRVDKGAVDALKNRGKSLLPSGVKKVSGQFERGDAVNVTMDDEQEFARGLTNYNTEEVSRLQGCQTDEISDILGYHDFDEIIHRDNLVIFPDD